MIAVCMWCGHTHGKIEGLKCKAYSQGFENLMQQGVPAWVLVSMLERYGRKILVDKDYFETCGENFVQLMEARREALHGSPT